MVDEVKATVTEAKATLPEAKVEPKAEKDIDGLIAELEKSGISSGDDLQAKLRASRENAKQAGHLANLMSTVRAENQELKELIKSMKTKKDDDADYGQGQPVDVEELVSRGVEKVLAKKEKAQQENQQRFLETWNTIQNDENYHLVGEVWEQKLKDPNFNYQLQTGQINPINAYNKTVVDYYKGMARRSADLIKNLKTGTIKAPHMETEGAIEKSKAPTPESKEKIQKLQEKVNKGYLPTDDELISLMGTF